MSKERKEGLQAVLVFACLLLITIGPIVYVNYVQSQDIKEAQQAASAFAAQYDSFEVLRSDDMTDPGFKSAHPVCTMTLESVDTKRHVLIYEAAVSQQAYERCMAIVAGDVVSVRAMKWERDRFTDPEYYLYFDLEEV